MSLMHGHIKALRALGVALDGERAHVTLAFPSGQQAVKTMLEHLSMACKSAADTLEREELALLEKIRETREP